MMNILNGGAHADSNVDIQEFMIAPIGAADLRRGAAQGRRGLPRAQVGAEAQGPVHRPRRRGRLRARPRVQPRRARPDPRGDRQGRLHAGRRHRARARRRGDRVLQRRRLPFEGAAQVVRRDDRLLRRPGRRLPDRVDRGPAGRGRLGRLGRADRAARRPGADRRRRPVRHQPRAAAAAASSSARRTRCWSR